MSEEPGYDAAIQTLAASLQRRVWFTVAGLIGMAFVAFGLMGFFTMELTRTRLLISARLSEAQEVISRVEKQSKDLDRLRIDAEELREIYERLIADARETSVARSQAPKHSQEASERAPKQLNQEFGDFAGNLRSIEGVLKRLDESRTVEKKPVAGGPDLENGPDVPLVQSLPPEVHELPQAAEPPRLGAVPAGSNPSFRNSISGRLFKAVGQAAALSAFDQWRGNVPEWGDGVGGQFRRFGSRVGRLAADRTIQYAIASLTGETRRICRSGETGMWPRIRHAAVRTVLTSTNEGETTVAYSTFAGAYGSALLATRWLPDGRNGLGQGLRNGTITLAGKAGKNILREFLPDVLLSRFTAPVCRGVD